jgi:NADPH-dependent curcumin reductase
MPYVTEELGFNACIDHRRSDFADRLAAACPKGIDIYFENVGGAVFEAVFPLLNPFARIPVCGLISMYNATSLSPGPILLPQLMRAILTKRLTFRGFRMTAIIKSRSRSPASSARSRFPLSHRN